MEGLWRGPPDERLTTTILISWFLEYLETQDTLSLQQHRCSEAYSGSWIPIPGHPISAKIDGFFC